MKKLIVTKLILFAFCLGAAAQKIRERNVPQSVRNIFHQQFPGIKKTYWGRDSVHYHVAFYTGKAPCTITYDSAGKVIITELQIPVEELPEEARKYIAGKYPNERYRDVGKLTDRNGAITYEVEVKGVVIVFDERGKVLSEQSFDE